MKIISTKVHAVIDYVLIVFLLLAPTLFDMSGLLAGFTYGLGIVHLGLTLCTAFSGGIFMFVPFSVHGLIEIIVGIALIICAYTIFRSSDFGKLFYTSLGTAILLVWLLTDYTQINKTHKS